MSYSLRISQISKVFFLKFSWLIIILTGICLFLIIGSIGWFGEDIIQSLIHQHFPFQAKVVEVLTLGPGEITPIGENPSKEEMISLSEERERGGGGEEEEEEEEEDSLEIERSLAPDKEASTLDLTEIKDEINEISEMVDILSQEVIALAEESLDEEAESEEDKEEEEDLEENKEDEEEEDSEVGQEVGQELCNRISSDYPKRNKIILNEIAWMGGSSSANDEWIELKNISENLISLSGWQLIDKERQIKVFFSEKDQISTNSFFLLERTDDSSVPNILADSIYTGSLSNNNEALYLFDENCQLEDEVLANPDWTAGDKSERRTIERDASLSWHTYYGFSQNGIFGTPKGENSHPPFDQPTEGGGGSVSSEPEPAFCSQGNLSDPVYEPVIFNEIAWMGTLTDWRDEWIELKNVSENDILLNGWQILDKGEEVKINLTGTIPANGFYLFERTNEGSVPKITADKIYTGNLEDNNETLRLFDKNCNLIDEIIANPDWPAGEKEERRSMERKQDLNWQTYSGEGEEGIMGTPKKENSQPQEEIDETPPLVSFNEISSLQINPNFKISWSGEDPENTALPSGIDGFLFRYSEDKENWNYFPLEEEYTQETEYYFIGEDNHNYYFQIKAKDKAGNESEWEEILITINSLPVVINEIAWMGTEISHNDEWMELFNNTDLEITLEGWQIKAIDGIPVISLTGKILPKGFYLLERTNEDALPNVLSDQIYTGALGNNGENLELYSLDNYLVDKVICKEDDQGNCIDWLAGNNATKQTMERKNPELPGNDLTNWETSQETGGTPKSQNSQYYTP